MQVITVANFKGGSTKTTTAGYLAHAFATQGLETLVIDADPQASTMRWSERAEWSIPTVALPTKTLHTRIPGIARPSTDVVVIDTPPFLDRAGIVYSALRAADTVVIPTGPTFADIELLPDIWAAIEEVEPLRAHPLISAVLFTRTIANANSTSVYRESLEDDGHKVLTAMVPRREEFGQAVSGPITDLSAYEAVATEVLNLGGHA